MPIRIASNFGKLRWVGLVNLVPYIVMDAVSYRFLFIITRTIARMANPRTLIIIILTSITKGQGAVEDGNRTNLVKTKHGIGIGNWWQNIELYSQYKFCFVMEHEEDHASYITEKIMMAFMAGM